MTNEVRQAWRASAVIAAYALTACSREPAPRRASTAAASAAGTASSSAAPPSAEGAGSALPDCAAPDAGAKYCHPTDPKLAKFWKELSATEASDLLKEHVAGKARARAGCALSAFLSGTNILSFEAAAPPKLLPLKPRWKGGDKGKQAPPLVPNLAGVLPQMDTATPLLEEEFEDGEGNFFTRRLYRAADGSYFLLLDYAG